MSNRLAAETSPYLIQHAGNPVDWFPWGEEALARSRREDKLIFLSIGYAACHWCHVMEHESFEDGAVAEILNRHFVSIKVDREERPDLDEIYMAATMLFSGGHGGWPMSVFLAPNLRPVYAGTYFPKEDAYGRPGFKTVLSFLRQKWAAERPALLASADQVTDAIRNMAQRQPGPSVPGPEHVEQGARSVYQVFDHSLGGISSGGNKFPQSMSLDLLLRAFRVTGEARYRRAVELTLERMCRGGIYDHLGGGLHRYATDTRWLVPHFEKMLYDQALVVPALLDASQAAEDPEKRRLFVDSARGICDYVLRDLRSPEGAFHSSEDADSEGKEGRFYVWTRDEVTEALGEKDARLFSSHYDVSEHGNWMHPGDAHVPSGPKNVLQVVRPADVIARLDGVAPAEVEASLARSRSVLFARRSRRVRPALDDKVLTGWNGLMISALAKAAAVLGERAYGDAAVCAADFLLKNLRRDDRLLATYGKGQARLTAYSTDYAFLIDGLLAVYEWNGAVSYLLAAQSLADSLIKYYWDQDGDGFFFTATDHEELIMRSKSAQDGATPSANSTMALSLQKLAVLLDRTDLRDKAGRILQAFVDPSARNVLQRERMLCALDAWHRGLDEIAIVGPPSDERTRALIAKVHAGYRPNKVVAQAAVGDSHAASLPLLAGRGLVDGKPAAYVCRNYACERPVTEPEQLFAAA